MAASLSRPDSSRTSPPSPSRCAVKETTALGAGYLAGIGVGFWSGPNDIATLWNADTRFQPTMSDYQRASLYADWQRAIQRASAWARE